MEGCVFYVLFVLRFKVPVNNYSVMSGRTATCIFVAKTKALTSRAVNQTCLLLRILRIFYDFGLQITHYESQLQNLHEKIQIFQ